MNTTPQRRVIRKIPSTITFANLNKELAYVLGLIYGDGTLDKRGTFFRIFSGDRDVLHTVQRVFDNIPRIHGIAVCVNSTRLWHELNELFGLRNNKAGDLKFPTLPPMLMPHFIRGLVDSDGCWSIKNQRWLMFTYSSVCRDFVEHLHAYIRATLGIGMSVHVSAIKKENYREIFRISLTRDDSLVLGAWIYNDSDGIRCSRKYETFCAATHLPRVFMSRSELSDLESRYRSGMTTSEIAQATGRDPSALARALRLRGVKMRSKHAGSCRLSRNDRDALCSRYLAGESMRTLAREFGYSYRGAFRLLASLGIKANRKHPTSANLS